MFCFILMDIDVPATAVVSLLNEQAKWEKKRQLSGTKENLHKRCRVKKSFERVVTTKYVQSSVHNHYS